MTLKRKLKNSLHYLYALYGAVRYGFPSKELFVIGITGTSGKSTTAYLLRQMLEAAGYTVGSLSTIDFYIAGEDQLNDQKMTMLGRGANHRYLRKMVDAGCDIAIVETTSEGALQHRHRFINYDTFIFTNLYPEHIESHGSFEHYKQTKLNILTYVANQTHKDRFGAFEKIQICKGHECPPKERVTIKKTLIAPLNNEHAPDVVWTGFEDYFVFGRKDDAVHLSDDMLAKAKETVLAEQVSVTAAGLQITIGTQTVTVPMYGVHNAQNVLAVCATARSLGISTDVMLQTIASFTNVPGRAEFIREAEALEFQVIVDYAFEPVAMKALYEIVALIDPTRLIHVCSSTGGGRDESRRAIIGSMAGKKADIVIVTDEDPYDEDPMAIIDAVAEAALAEGKNEGTTLFRILNRKEAIKQAVALATPGDLVIVTGKGSEQGMMVAGGKMIPWDDRDIVREGIREIVG